MVWEDTVVQLLGSTLRRLGSVAVEGERLVWLLDGGRESSTWVADLALECARRVCGLVAVESGMVSTPSWDGSSLLKPGRPVVLAVARRALDLLRVDGELPASSGELEQRVRAVMAERGWS
ncbi:hypothetical protein ACFY97_18700 [Streptomyces klenkii]|uniref:hypothetical protein n=1 Tax=Streptomyces klenkii TaxID=1420899 RepID=UPI0036E6C7D2